MALQVNFNDGFEPMTEQMLLKAEQFLIRCVLQSSNSKRFDDMKYRPDLIRHLFSHSDLRKIRDIYMYVYTGWARQKETFLKNI